LFESKYILIVVIAWVRTVCSSPNCWKLPGS